MSLNWKNFLIAFAAGIIFVFIIGTVALFVGFMDFSEGMRGNDESISHYVLLVLSPFGFFAFFYWFLIGGIIGYAFCRKELQKFLFGFLIIMVITVSILSIVTSN